MSAQNKAPAPEIKPWSGRFSEPVSDLVKRFTASVGFDYRLAEFDIEGSIAHARMLSATGIIGAFFTPTGAGTELADGKECRTLNGVEQVLEYPIHADFALIKAHTGDRWGNLVYHRGARVNNPAMAGAAKLVIAQVNEFVELGELDPEHIVTPGVFIDRVIEIKRT
jgi:3-oxoadipate CoA-transferase alpha subunit